VDLLHEIKNGVSEKPLLLYLNFAIENYASERSLVYQLFSNQSFCTVAASKPYDQYLLDLAQSKFILSPRGNGLDCHRTWEALWLGSIPIVKSSTLDSLLEDLPVLIVDEWSQIDEAYLNQKYAEMGSKSFNLRKLFFAYWSEKINSFR
jgi:hypothetical protein